MALGGSKITDKPQTDCRAGLRLVLWLLLLAAAVIFGVKTLKERDVVETDILAMLPHLQQDALTSRALDSLETRLANESYLVLTGEDKAATIKAARGMMAELANSPAFSAVRSGSELDPKDIYRLYFPARFHLLTESQRTLLEKGKVDVLIKQAEIALYSAFGFASSELISEDPLLLFPALMQGFGKGHRLGEEEGILLGNSGGQTAAIIMAKGKDSVFSPAAQEAQLNAINSAFDKVNQGNQLSLLKAGALFHALEATQSAKAEVSLIGSLSLAGVVLLVLLSFRSLMPLLMASLTLASAMVSASLFTILIFGKLHLLTLVFGTSLIGIAIDYSFHFYAERMDRNESAGKTLSRILPALTLALATSVLAYLALGFTPFPGMQQVAAFCGGGLIGAYLTLYLAYPALAGSRIQGSSAVINLASSFLAPFEAIGPKAVVLGNLIIFVVGAAGLGKLSSHDDIRSLQQGSDALMAEEARVRNLLSGGVDNQFLLVRADSMEALLMRLEALAPVLTQAEKDQLLQSHVNLADYLPSGARQLEDYRLQRQIYGPKLGYIVARLGLDAELEADLSAKYQAGVQSPLAAEAFFTTALGASLKPLLLEPKAKDAKAPESGAQEWGAIVLLGGIQDLPAVNEAVSALPGVTLVDKVGDISALMGNYRQTTLWLLALALFIAFGVFALRHSRKLAAAMVAVPALAALLSLSLLGLLGSPLTLFHALALLLVFGIGVDYSLFFARDESREDGHRVMLAVLLSATSTTLAFGLLALSNTPAIHYFGLTLALGIGFTLLLSPLIHTFKRKLN
ncbi:MMPL family transporter [Shewanella litorisediminis]|uniref:MMPL family transporter n=1 Tax=Shewanella litorisediminis TaxID=1173586 RepID=A0ABX7G2P4_9GAMM|nr:MMPL family transporter [Shewanella litorisediminis]MCL2917122.1 MMPL family transporter [Shewanella litorisediminis]QRH01599.1 MMPL family transporter [Shewanella litorisediminis]